MFAKVALLAAAAVFLFAQVRDQRPAEEIRRHVGHRRLWCPGSRHVQGERTLECPR